MIRNLMNLSDKDLSKIRSANKGKETLIAVHPFWTPENSLFEMFLKEKLYKDYLTIVFEKSGLMPKVQDTLTRFGVKNSNSFFFVYTKTRTSTPTAGWQKLFAKLDAIGVKKIFVGGRVLTPFNLDLLRSQLAKEKKKKLRNKYIYDAMRTANRAAKISKSKTAWQHCAGHAWAKLAARGKYKVRTTRIV